MADFGIGNPALQHFLEWVDQSQSPPAQTRDTHALVFNLQELAPPPEGVRLTYEGLMYFRPKFTGSGPVGSTLGLDGLGHLHISKHSCEPFMPSAQPFAPRVPDWVKVFLGFRPRASGPAHVFATLQFLKRVLPDVPAGQTVEFSHVNATGNGLIEMDAPPSHDDGWLLGFRETTVLLRSP